jgi:hypothetical protein
MSRTDYRESGRDARVEPDRDERDARGDARGGA